MDCGEDNEIVISTYINTLFNRNKCSFTISPSDDRDLNTSFESIETQFPWANSFALRLAKSTYIHKHTHRYREVDGFVSDMHITHTYTHEGKYVFVLVCMCAVH